MKNLIFALIIILSFDFSANADTMGIVAYELGGPPTVNGECGTAHTVPVSSIPTSNLCITGVESVVTGVMFTGFA